MAISEESLHQMFVGLARVDQMNPTKLVYMYEKDVAQKVPSSVQKFMAIRNKKQNASSYRNQLQPLKFTITPPVAAVANSQTFRAKNDHIFRSQKAQ